MSGAGIMEVGTLDVETITSISQLVELFQKGFRIGNLVIYSHHHSAGRVKEEENFDLYLSSNTQDVSNAVRLMSVKLFHGRKPHYLPWMELHLINHELMFSNGTVFFYFGSDVEKELLSLISNCDALPRIFVDYMNDAETRSELYRDVPPVLSRLGFLLFTLGFTWFKDWYYPEGFKEGGVKLQAEKAMNVEHENNQLARLKNEVQSFLARLDEGDALDVAFNPVLERARVVLSA